MGAWTQDELNKIGAAEELQIAGLRSDGTLRKAVTIWVVRVGDDLYVRSVHGRDSAWFKGILVRHAGHVQAGGVAKDVSFTEIADAALNAQIDAVYRTKYRRYAASIIDSIVSPAARSATIQLVVR